MKFYVFYSNQCTHSMKLVQLIQNEKLLDECNLILLETTLDKIPDFIKSVPTIVAPNLSKPLVGIETIEWIKNKKYFNQITNNIQNNNVIQPNIKSALEGLEFNKLESTSISDHYTNINDTPFDKVMLDFNKISENAPITHNLTHTIISDKIISDTKIISDAKIISDTKIISNNRLKELILFRKNQINSFI